MDEKLEAFAIVALFAVTLNRIGKIDDTELLKRIKEAEDELRRSKGK